MNKKFRKVLYIFLFCLCIFLLIIYTLIFMFDSGVKYIAGCVIIALIVSIFYIIKYGLFDKKNTSKYRDYLVKELERKDDEANWVQKESDTNNKKEKETAESTENIENQFDFFEARRDIIALMLKNNDETTEYFKISKLHAKISFGFSIIACIIGIGMLSLAIYGMFAIKDFQYVIIGTVSGAITEVVAGTVLLIHNKSALQLNYYYDALHQNERFLSAVNLADKLSDKKRDEMYVEIIRKQIEVPNKPERGTDNL